MERLLAQLPWLSEVTISDSALEDIYFFADNNLRLSFFKKRLSLAQAGSPMLNTLPYYSDPDRSIIDAFKSESDRLNPWCEHVLRARSALHLRPRVKVYAEVERLLWNDPPESRVRNCFAPRRVTTWCSEAYDFPWPAVKQNHRAQTLFDPSHPLIVKVVGRMDLED